MEEAEQIRAEEPRLSLEIWESKTYDRFLREHHLVRFDGALVFGNYFHVVHGNQTWPSLDSLGIPWINTSNRFDLPHVPKVAQDDLAIGRMAGKFLASLSPAAFAYVGFPEDFLFSEERRLGFIQGAGISPEVLLEAPRQRGLNHREPESELTERLNIWIASLPRRTAVFTANDEKGAHLLSLLKSFPRRVPEDITVIGADDEPAFTKRTNLSLSSIHPAGAAVGRRALRCLLTWIQAGERPPSVTPVDGAILLERRSTDHAAVDDPAIYRLLRQLRDHPEEAITAEAMARVARLSERSLLRRFRIATGTTPNQYLKTLRINRARRLLAESTLPVTRVAESAGFHDHKWFHRAFVASTGMSPRAYRQRILCG